MVLKKKVTAAVLAGVLATAAVVPMGLTASAAPQGDVQVQYIGGALVPGGSDGSYYITIPSNVLFSGQDDTADMTVQLHRTDVTKTLRSDLAVTVDVYSTNNYKLVAAGQTEQGTYELKYDSAANLGTSDLEQQAALVNTTHGTPSADNGDEAGVLEVDSTLNTIYDVNNNPTGNQTTLVGSIKGQAEMTVEPTVDVPGTSFKDTLTYYVTQTV